MRKQQNIFEEQSRQNINSQTKSSQPYKESSINRNGFTHRPTLYQILLLAYVIISIIIFTWNLMYITLSRNFVLAVCLMCITFIILMVVFVAWYLTTTIDPTDQVQIQHNRHKQLNKQFNKNKIYKFYCNICQTFTSNDTYHCKKCNRCVQFFDNHCIWVNNCIGASNYIEYVVLLFAGCLEEGFKIAVNVTLVVKNPQYIKGNYLNMGWLVICNCVLTFFTVVPFICLFYLSIRQLCFCFLRKATVQVILQSRKKSKIHPNAPIKNEKSLQQKQNNKKDGICEQLSNDQGKTPQQLLKKSIQIENIQFRDGQNTDIRPELPPLILNKYSRPTANLQQNDKSARKRTVKSVVSSKNINYH